jgi:hypothetical protein
MRNKHEAVENTVQAKPGVITLNRLKSLENWRAFIHQITPVIVTTLVSIGIITNSQVMLWVPLIFAIIDHYYPPSTLLTRCVKLSMGLRDCCPLVGWLQVCQRA